jgi:hypothetical protein
MIPPTTAAVKAWSKRAKLAPFIGQLTPEAVAGMVCRSVITALAGERPWLGRTAMTLTQKLDRASVRASGKRISWGLSERARLAVQLLHICADATGTFEIVEEDRGNKTVVYLRGL